VLVSLIIENRSTLPIRVSGFGDTPTSWNAETAGVSLVDISRDGQQRNLYLQRPVVTPPHTISGQSSRMVPPGGIYARQIDAAKWLIADGWKPGRYQVSIRADALHLDNHTTAWVLSTPSLPPPTRDRWASPGSVLVANS